MIATAPDPHHNGRQEFGWDGYDFWKREPHVWGWQRMKRMKVTRARIEALASLLCQEKEDAA